MTRIDPQHHHHPLASGVTLHAVHWDPPADTAAAMPWLLVHGLASNARLWDGVARHLAQAGHPVVAVDQRGHGLSDKPDGPYDMETVADDLQLLIAHLDASTDVDWSQPAVAGQSWGGNVAIELGYRHRELPAVVACVDGGSIELRDRFPVWDDAEAQMRPPALIGTPLDVMRQRLDVWASDWPEEGRAGTLANFEVRDDGTIAPWLTLERHLLVLRGLWEHSPRMRYAAVTAPVLFVSADSGDREWTESKHAALDVARQLLPRSRSEWFVPAHHDVHAQHPAEVAALLHRASTDPNFFESTAADDPNQAESSTP